MSKHHKAKGVWFETQTVKSLLLLWKLRSWF